MALCSSRRLVRGMGSVPGQYWWSRVMSCPGLAWHPSWRRIVNHRVCFPLPKAKTSTVVLFSLSLKFRITFENSYHVIPCDVKYDGDCISRLTFVVVYRDVTRQAKGLYHLKHVGALGMGLAYLSRYNSGWFCHMRELGLPVGDANRTLFLKQWLTWDAANISTLGWSYWEYMVRHRVWWLLFIPPFYTVPPWIRCRCNVC
jgi:hypothetical protein